MSILLAKSKAEINQRADLKKYSDDQLISFKTALHLPYFTGAAAYERAYGTVEIRGVTYQYVLRRVYKDTLELLCLPNDDIRKINELKTGMAGQAAEGRTVPHKTAKVWLPDLFFNTALNFNLSAPIAIPRHARTGEVFPRTGYRSQPDQPPRPLQCT